jgi:hypothetical protein
MPVFLGSRSGVSPALRVLAPPAPQFLGNAVDAAAALPVNTPATALSLGDGVGRSMALSHQQPGRLDQIQYGRFSWFENPEVQQQLNLTADQRLTLRSDIGWSWQQREQISRLAATDPPSAERLHRNYEEEYRRRLSQLLTPDQKRAWQQMTSEPYNFQPQFMSTTTGPR